METFKERMRRIRLRAGFTSQGKAAAVIGCERGTVSMWEAPSSAVQTVSSEWLFATARAYRVRPEWINDLRSRDDGYPFTPDLNPSASTTPTDATAKAGTASQTVIPDPDILHEALTLLLYDETVAGAYAPRAQAARLAELYGRVAADQGRLSAAHNREFEDEVQDRRGSHATSTKAKARKRQH